MYYLLGQIFQPRHLQNALVYSLLLIGLSCSFGSDSESGVKSQNYKIAFQSPQWTKINPGSADHAFQNSSSNSIILLNSLCGKYESTSLKHLISNMLGGLDQVNIVKEEKMTYAKRDSLRRFVTGKTDGVPVYLIIQTLRKDSCIYDFILISANQDLQTSDIDDFNKFLEETNIN